MSFAWSIWSPLHLLVDGLLVYVAWRYSRRRQTKRLGENEGDPAALNISDLFAIIAPTIGVLIAISVLLFFLGGIFAFARVAWTTATVIVPGLFLYYGILTGRHWLAVVAGLLLVFKFYGEAYEPLLFAGHTHGGQIVLPGFGPLVTLSRVKREIAAGGLHEVDRLRVLVSRGLGWEGHVAPRVRLFCRPHAIFLTITPDAQAEVKADVAG